MTISRKSSTTTSQTLAAISASLLYIWYQRVRPHDALSTRFRPLLTPIHLFTYSPLVITLTTPAQEPASDLRKALSANTCCEMLQRRVNADSANAKPPASPSTHTSTPPKSNTAYKPLRRTSSNLYPTSQTGSKPRYSLPSPSLGLPTNSAGYGYGGNGSGNGNVNGYGFGGTYDLTEGFGSGSSGYPISVDYMAIVRGVLDRFKRGMEDACRLDKSLTMVFGLVYIFRAEANVE